MGRMFFAWVDVTFNGRRKLLEAFDIPRDKTLLGLLGDKAGHTYPLMPFEPRGFPEGSQDWLVADGVSDWNEEEEWVARGWLRIRELERVLNLYSEIEGSRHPLMEEALKSLRAACALYQDARFVYGIS